MSFILQFLKTPSKSFFGKGTFRTWAVYLWYFKILCIITWNQTF